MGIKKLNLNTVILVFILVIGAFLRLYRLPEMAPFDFDQEYAANFAFNVLKVYPVQLIGQPLSVEGLFMGPWYFYYLVPFFAIFNLHPLGGLVGSITLSLVIILAYFFLGKALFNSPAGLILSFTRAVSIYYIGQDLNMVPAYSSELLVLATIFLLYSYWQGKTSLLPFLGLTFGLFTSFHPIQFPFYLVFLALFIFKRVYLSLKILVVSIIAFLLPNVPLIIFEVLHNFLEVKRIVSLFSQGSSSVNFSSNFWKHLAFNIGEPGRILNLPFISQQAVFFLLFGILIYLIIKKIAFWKDNFHITFFATTFIAFILYYTFFPTHVPEYYFYGIRTLIFFYFLGTISLLGRKKYWPLLVLFLVYFFAANFIQLKARWDNPSLSNLYHKDTVVKEILKKQPKEKEFYVSYIKEPGWNFGFNYLFRLYGQTPQTQEAKPPIYTIVIPKSLSLDSLDFSSGNVGLILPN